MGGRSGSELLRYAASTTVMATTGMLSRTFIYATQKVEVDNLESFLRVLDARRKAGRTQGLLTGLHLPYIIPPIPY